MDRANTIGSSAADSRSAVHAERVVLTGFMGSGKTTIGGRLARRLGWRFVDLDSEIEQRNGHTVARIFAQSGEARFRALETKALASALREPHIVLALGGGALETDANRELLAASAHTRIILLTAPFDILYDRCQRQIDRAAQSALPVRPLLGDREAAAARLDRREALYRQTADLILDTTGQHPEESVESLLALLKASI